METSQEIEAARKILAGSSAEIADSSKAQKSSSDPKMDGNWGSRSEPEENLLKQVSSSDLNRDDDSVIVTKCLVETETVVETSFEKLESDLGAEKDDENEAENINNVSNVDVTNCVTLGAYAFGSSDDVDGREKMFKNKDEKGSSAENAVVLGSYNKQLNGTVTMGKNIGQTGEKVGKVGVPGNNEIMAADNEKMENKENWVGQEHGFRVGDLVWGKIKGHPWWPGQIHNPLDASEFAEKHGHAGQAGRLLVAFFGDGSCAWCLPSQLIPFVENFKDNWKDSSSKSFLNAVQRAVDEIGRLVESDMTCKCIPEERKVGLSRPLVENVGIKDGVLVPEVDIGRLSTPMYEPAELLARVRSIAVAVSVGSMIEFAVLKSWLSAFNRSKGGGCLPVYCEPQEIEGLEDNSKNVIENKSNNVDEVMIDFSVPIEVPIGPLEDDSSILPTEGTGNSAAPSNGRKQKSVAELMKENPEVKPKIKKRTTVTEGTGKSKSVKKRKGNNRDVEDGGNGEASSSQKKIVGKRNTTVSESSKILENKVSNAASDDVGVVVKNDDPLVSRPKENNVLALGNVTEEAIEASEMVSSPRERKKSRYLSPPYTNLKWREGSSSFKKRSEVESEKNTKIAHAGDIPVEKLPNKQQQGLDMSVNLSEASEDTEKMTFTSAVDVSVSDMLSEIQVAAVDHVYLTKKSYLNAVSKFTSAFRSSIYSQGSDYKIFHKCQSGRKRKSLHSQPDNLGNDLTQKKARSSEPKSTKASNQKKVMKSDTIMPRKGDGSLRSKKSADKSGRKTSSMSLILTFSPGFTLPAKEEIVQQFSKFGSLNETETCLVPDSDSVKVVYMNDRDAREAFRSSVNKSPFGSQCVNYVLQHSSTGSTPHGSHTKISEEPDSYQHAEGELPDVGIIREKLEMMEAMLENCSDKIPPKDKSSLKDELKSLLEKVETSVEKVKRVVENTSSF